MSAVATRPPGSSKLTAGQLPAWTSGVVLTVSLVVAASLFTMAGSFGLVRILAVTLLLYGIVMVAASAAVEGKRKAQDRLATTLVTSAFVLALLPLVSLVISVIGNGSARLDGTFSIYSLRSVVGEGGGAAHAIAGTL